MALGSSMSVFAVVAVLGNALFWFALLYDKRALGISNAFLMNLSVSDFVVGVWNMPITVISVAANKWLLGKTLCNFSAFVDNTMLLISVWTVACSSLDKFYMVQYPLHYHRNITWARVTKLIVGIWVVAGLCNSPPLFSYQGLEFNYSTWSYSCGLICPQELYGQALVKALESSSHRRNTVSDCNKVRVDLEIPRTSPNSTSNLVQKNCARANEKTARASVMMSCLVPITVVGFLHFIDGSLITIGPEFVIAFHWLLLSGSAVNPVLYGIVNPFFRRAYLKLILIIKSKVWSSIIQPITSTLGCKVTMTTTESDNSNNNSSSRHPKSVGENLATNSSGNQK
ncbi:rhodopsin, GQ-coupled-like [Bolinopsis microptera]|uniref:rhodopsin, GQ-coupled-like n=1 Tax=Bolinopsis microptera TaxID=2820187 RepID=UPI003079FCF8